MNPPHHSLLSAFDRSIWCFPKLTHELWAKFCFGCFCFWFINLKLKVPYDFDKDATTGLWPGHLSLSLSLSQPLKAIDTSVKTIQFRMSFGCPLFGPGRLGLFCRSICSLTFVNLSSPTPIQFQSDRIGSSRIIVEPLSTPHSSPVNNSYRIRCAITFFFFCATI